MADRTTTKIIETRPSAGRDSFPIADGVTVAAGTLVQLEAGFLNHWDDSASNDVFVGIVIGGEDRAGDGIIIGETSDTPDPRAFVDTSGVILMHLDSINGTPSQAKVGDLIYCDDSDTDNMDLQASGNTNAIGVLWEFRSTTDCDVKLFTPAEYIAVNYESAGT